MNIKKKLNLQVLYTNDDGLLNKKYELNLLMNCLDVKPDSIAITEIKPNIFYTPVVSM